MNEDTITGNTVPWYPTLAISTPSIFQTGTVPSKSACPYEYPFNKSGWIIIAPITAPKTGVPPKILVAEKPIKTGKNVNAALEKVFIISAKSVNLGYTSINDYPFINKPSAVSTLLRPINNPAATSAGNIGTNTSARAFKNLCNTFAFLADIKTTFN